MVNVRFKRFSEGAYLPEIALNKRQAGIDFFLADDITIPANGSVSTNLRIGWEPEFILPLRFLKYFFKIYMQLKSRSGLAFKKGIEVTAAGVIDEDYRGEINVILYNHRSHAITINKETAVCQGIVKIIPLTKIKEIKQFKEDKATSSRGEKGFGSSDKV